MTTLNAVRPDLPLISGGLPGPRALEIVERDARVLSPSYTRPYPLVVDHAQGAIVTDVDGNRFLDFNAGIAVVATGHCHPEVVRAVQEQAARLIHMSGTDFYYENMVQLAETLARLAPGNQPRRVYFGNSGTEAVEAALKLARYHTGRDKFIAFYGCFHGRTLGALALTSRRPVQREGVSVRSCRECTICRIRIVIDAPMASRPIPAAWSAPVSSRTFSFLKTILPATGNGRHRDRTGAGRGRLHRAAAQVLRRIGGNRPAQQHPVDLRRSAVGHGAHGKNVGRRIISMPTPEILAVTKGIASGMPLGAMIANAEVMNWPPGSHAS